MPRLYSDRIVFREYKISDLDNMRKWVNDPKVVDNLSDIFLYPHSLNQTDAFLHSMLEGTKDSKGFVIAQKDTDDYIGQIDLVRIDWKNRVAVLGIVIGDEQNRNKGYGAEAIKVMQEFVFNRLNLNRLELTVHDYNEAAYRCYAKCGFKEEGRLRQKFFINGVYSDTIIMSILKSEYENLKH